VIYLDHHAATPLRAAVVRAMDEARAAGWANPSSVHAAGRRARAVLEGARDAVAGALGASPSDVVLTGGGTEACNLGVLGLGRAAKRVVVSAVEHPAVSEAVARLEARGLSVVRLPAPDGRVPEPAQAGVRLDVDTLVCLAWVSHETGTVFPVEAWAAACGRAGASMFVDATQALGKLPVAVDALGADAVAFAASKLGGPAGAGSLWVRRGREVAPVLAGGAQERGRRPGTPDVVAHAGFGAACAGLPERLSAMEAIGARRDALEAVLVAAGAVVNGAGAPRVATVTNTSVPAWRGETLVAALDLEGLCASSGAACSSGLGKPSPVVRAMVPDAPWRAESALRLSLGPETTDDEVARAGAVLRRVLARGGSSGKF